MATTFPYIIQELNGARRSIVLRGRSLPHRGVDYGGTQRVAINYFAGNPVASSQVIGPTYDPTTIRGRWSDVFLDQGTSSPSRHANSAILEGFPQIGDRSTSSTFAGPANNPVPTQYGDRARIVRDAFEIIRRSGALLKVEWGSLSRVGHLMRTSFSHDREEDIRFEIEFNWIGDTEASPKILTKQNLDTVGFLRSLIDRFQNILDSMDRVLATIYGGVLVATQLVRRLGSLVTDLLDTLSQFAALTIVPAELFGAFKQQLVGVQLAATDLVAQLRSTPTAYQAQKQGTPVDVNTSVEDIAALIKESLIIAAESAVTARRIDALESSSLAGVYVSPGNVTLRDVSQRFYGTPERWVDIRQFNGLSRSVLDRGVIVRVPKLET